MKKMIEFLEKYFVPVAGRIGSQRHLVAIRDGFCSIMPIVIAGSLAILINAFPVEAYQGFMNAIFGVDHWKSFGGNIWTGSFAVMSLLVTFSISYNLAKSYSSDALSAALVSLGTLSMFFAASKTGDLPYNFLGPNGLFVAIIIAILATELFVKLAGNEKLIINMPEGVPPAVSKSFAALLPAILVMVVFSLFKCLLVTIGVLDLHKLIFEAIQAPLTGMADSFGSAIIIVFLVHLLWFFGLHGTNIMEPIMQTIYIPLLNDNMKALQANTPLPHIVTKPFFDAFVYLGGAGSSICLLVAIFIISKRKQMRTIANLGIAPACFNITEPVIFGLPIVLNPVLIVPFILIPLVLTAITYFTMAIGLVPRTIVMIPWTTPPIFGGFLATGSWRGAVLAAFNLVVGIALYIPFIVSADRYEQKKENEIKIESNSAEETF